MQAITGVLLVLSLVLTGCGPGSYQPGPSYLEGSAGISTVPPSWYGGDPAMREWYSFPYSNLEAP